MTVLLVGGVAWVGAHDLDPRRPLSSTANPHVQVASLMEMAVHLSGARHRSVNHLTVPVGAPITSN